jgi:hypothetical protein
LAALVIAFLPYGVLIPAWALLFTPGWLLDGLTIIFVFWLILLAILWKSEHRSRRTTEPPSQM